MVDTVTSTAAAEAVSDDTTRPGSVQKPRSIEDDKPPTNIALPHEGLSYRFPFDTEKKTYAYFAIRSRRRPSTPTTTAKTSTAHHLPVHPERRLTPTAKLVEPIKYARSTTRTRTAR